MLVETSTEPQPNIRPLDVARGVGAVGPQVVVNELHARALSYHNDTVTLRIKQVGHAAEQAGRTR